MRIIKIWVYPCSYLFIVTIVCFFFLLIFTKKKGKDTDINLNSDTGFGSTGPRVAVRLLAPLREGYVPWLLLQEGAVEAAEDEELE